MAGKPGKLKSPFLEVTGDGDDDNKPQMGKLKSPFLNGDLTFKPVSAAQKEKLGLSPLAPSAPGANKSYGSGSGRRGGGGGNGGGGGSGHSVTILLSSLLLAIMLL